jgi:glycosyltransferase involved in cell wall biosynthesis
MMPAFNAARFIRASIESVLAQRSPNWELVIVDDGSTDETFAIASSFRDPRIRIVRQSNRGEAAARNAALETIRGEFLAFLDADDLYLPDHLPRLTAYFASHPDAVGVVTDGFHITEDDRRLQRLSSRRRPPRAGRVFDEIVFGSDFLGPPVCVALRREPLERHALRFDQDIVMGPDWDFFVRYSRLGPFGFITEATCLYRVHARSITTTMGAAARARERAKCRARAIRLPEFGACPPHVRFNAFYDLLVVALRGEAQQQQAVIGWGEFRQLPPPARSRLLRLLASEARMLGYYLGLVREWLREARRANPRDLKALAMSSLVAAHPGAFAAALRRRRAGQFHSIDRPPFADHVVP